jgi:hypothetical protein
MHPDKMSPPVRCVIQQLAQWNNIQQAWRRWFPVLSGVSADLKGHNLIDVSMELKTALADIGLKFGTVGQSPGFPGTMRVEGIEKLGEIDDGKCRSRSDHMAIAEQKRELTAEYSLYWLSKQMNDKETITITDSNGNHHRGKIIGVGRKNDHNYFWVVKMTLENIPETSVECVVSAA